MGRGTATYDGLSLAWATVEHLHDRIGARTLFATHYHELTLLAERLARLTNLRVTVKETQSGIVFLHTVEAGAASKSYGIEVARLAGLPAAVISRAREVLKVHERAETQQVREAAAVDAPQMQMTMFTPLSQRIVDRLSEIDVDGLTPREALNLLAELQRELKGLTMPKAMVVAGVMSGTSADGVDVALCRISPARNGGDAPRVKLLGHAGFGYSKAVRAAVLAAMDAEAASVADLSRLNWRLGEIYADAWRRRQRSLE